MESRIFMLCTEGLCASAGRTEKLGEGFSLVLVQFTLSEKETGRKSPRPQTQAFDHLTHPGWLLHLGLKLLRPDKGASASQTGPGFLSEQNLWLPHSVTAWERPTSAGPGCPLCPLIFPLRCPKRQVRDFELRLPPRQRGAGQEQNRADRSQKLRASFLRPVSHGSFGIVQP